MDTPISQTINVRLNIQADKATPILACMLAEILKQHGAEVKFSNPERCAYEVSKPINLKGLKVNIDQLTHVSQVEASRW